MAENGNGKSENGNGKSVTYKWLAYILCGLLIGIASWAWSNTQTSIKDNKVAIDRKVEKEQYYRDLNGINKKLDVIEEYIRRR